MKRRFKTQFDQNYTGTPGALNELASMTQPGEVQSLKQMLINHVRGIPQNAPFGAGSYFGDTVVPDPRVVDLVEIEQFSETLKDIRQSFADFVEMKKKPPVEPPPPPAEPPTED